MRNNRFFFLSICCRFKTSSLNAWLHDSLLVVIRALTCGVLVLYSSTKVKSKYTNISGLILVQVSNETVVFFRCPTAHNAGAVKRSFQRVSHYTHWVEFEERLKGGADTFPGLQLPLTHTVLIWWLTDRERGEDMRECPTRARAGRRFENVNTSPIKKLEYRSTKSKFHKHKGILRANSMVKNHICPSGSIVRKGRHNLALLASSDCLFCRI